MKADRFPPDLRAQARRLYVDEHAPVAEVLALLGVSERTFYRLVPAWDWPLREPKRAAAQRTASARHRAPARPPTAVPAPATPSLAAAAARLARAAADEIAAIEERRDAWRTTEPERIARSLAALAAMLEKASDLIERRPAREDPDEKSRPARSLNELRDQLYRRMLRVRQHYGAQRGARGPQGPGA